METRTVHVRVVGRVQGVFFRDYTRREAERLSISGWVKNSPDGSVEALLSGSAEAVDAMLEWLHEGSPAARVQRVVVDESAAPPHLSGFQITF